jgi:hypothetical protein
LNTVSVALVWLSVSVKISAFPSVASGAPVSA